MSEIINTIYVLRQEYNQTPPEIDCCLNDLPNNDFNTTFKFIPSFNKKLIREGCCFVSGVPGSFYSRIFPWNSLHFIHSIYSIHYLSKRLLSLFDIVIRFSPRPSFRGEFVQDAVL
ncbi:PREDICTED: salicylate/benzoate carboxyl methyltransferase-like [Brassica oleracea var. oleracea]|uniref:salicylate/benzoate carboxyl methyltransferase-like n=1 Tax=Brassica oleracea var. oleracea TaxID=109376 RepID=UPI0006A6B7B9|nr:PREDICTED: salicylate/benzoate carboxyl methyltransferase-like [Brassica oleracea var. oleracea]